LGWEHINLLGRYSFETQTNWALDNLRPLRGEAEVVVEDEAARPVGGHDGGRRGEHWLRQWSVPELLRLRFFSVNFPAKNVRTPI
jgi:hypothetical protein